MDSPASSNERQERIGSLISVTFQNGSELVVPQDPLRLLPSHIIAAQLDETYTGAVLPHRNEGEHTEDPFGRILNRLTASKANFVNMVLESGTGTGTGTSMAIAKGLASRGPVTRGRHLVTVEILGSLWREAVYNLRELPAVVVRGASTGPDAMMSQEAVMKSILQVNQSLGYPHGINKASGLFTHFLLNYEQVFWFL